MVNRNVILFSALLAASCSVLIGRLSDCSTDADCTPKGAGLTCAAGVCVSSTSARDGGSTDAGGTTDAGGPTDAGGTGDAGCNNGTCYACTPTNNAQFLNACTTGCVPFDNARVTIRLADGGFPAIPPLPVVDAGTRDAGPPDAGSPDAGDADAGDIDAGPIDAGVVVVDAGITCGANGNPTVYIIGSTAAKPYLAALARTLFNDTQPVNLIYQSVGSCTGVDVVLNQKNITGTASAWDPASTNVDNEVICRIPAPLVPDVAISDVFAQSCTALPNGLPSSFGDFIGPIQTMTFVVPAASTQRSISAEAAYAALGFGAASGTAPWTDNNFIIRRNAGSGTQALIAAALGVPSGLFKGIDGNGSGGVVTKVSSSTQAEKTLGILADTDITESLTLSLKVLAYQHYGQTCGYYPDSTSRSRDKQNVRDGHYALWGPLHILTPVNASGFPRSTQAQRIVSFITGTVAPPGGLDLIEIGAVHNMTPTCAMAVTRTSEMGPLVPYTPPTPCSCKFEFISTGTTTCTPCMTASTCPSTAPRCSAGYCEK